MRRGLHDRKHDDNLVDVCDHDTFTMATTRCASTKLRFSRVNLRDREAITAITSLVQQLQATTSQARGDSTAAAITPGTYTTTGGNTSTQTNNSLKLDLGGGTSVSIST